MSWTVEMNQEFPSCSVNNKRMKYWWIDLHSWFRLLFMTVNCKFEDKESIRGYKLHMEFQMNVMNYRQTRKLQTPRFPTRKWNLFPLPDVVNFLLPNWKNFPISDHSTSCKFHLLLDFVRERFKTVPPFDIRISTIYITRWVSIKDNMRLYFCVHWYYLIYDSKAKRYLINVQYFRIRISHERGWLLYVVVVDACTYWTDFTVVDYFDYMPVFMCVYSFRYHQIEFRRNLLCVLINRKIMK